MTRQLLLLALGITIFACKKPAPEPKPHCDLASEVLDGNYECGTIQVPEDHNQPDGRKIDMSYVILKAFNENSTNSAMIYFRGGPGAPTVTKGKILEYANHPVRQERDIILYDQRGIGFSSSLPNISDGLFQIMSEDLTYEEELKRVQDLIAEYSQLCREQGIGLKHYNTFQSSKDVGVLMEQLGYDKYNLYGGSYGGRLARAIQDEFPSYLNTVILNSPDPLSGDFIIDRLKSYSVALERFFNFCESDPTCSEQNPNIREAYISGLVKLKENPIEVTYDGGTFYVNEQDGVYMLRRMLYRTNSRTEAPEMIKAYNEGSGDILQEALRFELSFTAGYNASMMMAVERYEKYNLENTSDVIEAAYESSPLLPAKLGYFTSLYLASKNWHDGYLPMEERKFQTSSIPTMIFVNQYDPVTPPEYGRMYAEKLENGRLFILDEGGHGGGNQECKGQLFADFMNDPENIDTSCLNLYVE